jgi:hypothetical protein
MAMRDEVDAFRSLDDRRASPSGRRIAWTAAGISALQSPNSQVAVWVSHHPGS